MQGQRYRGRVFGKAAEAAVHYEVDEHVQPSDESVNVNYMLSWKLVSMACNATGKKLVS